MIRALVCGWMPLRVGVDFELVPGLAKVAASLVSERLVRELLKIVVERRADVIEVQRFVRTLLSLAEVRTGMYCARAVMRQAVPSDAHAVARLRLALRLITAYVVRRRLPQMAAPARRLQWQFQLLDLHPSPSRPKPTLLPPPPPVEPGQKEAVRRLRAALDPALARKVTSATELIHALDKARRTDCIPTTLESFDALLGGGLQRGKVIEVVARRATGRFSVAMSALAAATTIGEAAALVDLGDHFDPQLAEANGVDLRRLLWIRPQTLKQAVTAAEMITATGFQLVVLDTGLHPIRGRRVPDAVWVRLARAAEAHGTAMLISSPYALTGTASEAVIKGGSTCAKWLGRGKGPRLLAGINTNFTLEKHRHIRPGAAESLELRAVSS